MSTRKSSRRSKTPNRLNPSQEEEQQRQFGADLVGSKVRKHFEGHGWFNGYVKSCDDDGRYFVIYEDDDEEEYYIEELMEILVDINNNNNDDEGQEEEYKYQENDGQDDEELEEEYLEEEQAKPKLPATPRKASPRKSTPTKSNSARKNKNKSTSITPSPTSKKSSSKASVRSAISASTGSNLSSSTKGSTIAERGLPRGALGRCSKTGFTIRALEGIRPLKGSSSWSSAAFVSPSSSSRRNGSSTSNSGSTNITNDLPGPMMVVSQDRNGVIIPTNFVGKTFASASDLHAALSKVVNNGDHYQLATYELEPVADPSFSSWEYAQARLVSAGLTPSDEEEDEYRDTGTKNGPFVVQISWDGGTKITGTVCWYNELPDGKNDDGIQWAIIEGNDHGKQFPPVLIGAPQDLIEHHQLNIENLDAEVNPDQVISDLSAVKSDGDGNEVGFGGSSGSGNYLLPPPSKTVAHIRLPASLLQKSIRRGSGLCTPSPLLQACASLLLPENARPGSTLAMLKAVWGGMIVDASPFEDSSDCLGLPALLLLSLVAKADPEWTMPPTLRRAAVVAALRTATSAPSQPWIGYVHPSDTWWHLESIDSESSNGNDQRATSLRNILRAAQVVVGGRLAWGKWSKFIGDPSAAAAIAYLNKDWKGSYLPRPPSPYPDEMLLIKEWEEGKQPPIPEEPRLQHLDQECCLAAIEPMVMPSTLVLLQAVLSYPPTQWKKHGLPSLSKQIRKLISEANPRYRQRMQLARLATWGKKETESLTEREQLETLSETYNSYREVVTHTGNLSKKEIEVVDSYEAIQRWQFDHLQNEPPKDTNDTVEKSNQFAGIKSCRVKAGSPPTAFDGRVAFLLAFASAIEVEVCPDPDSSTSREVVSAMFCGDPDEPLLVQRIGKARKEGQELATGGGSSSGATAVPSLGYVQRARSAEEAKLMEAAEIAVAAYWEGGQSLALPIPPPGFQWELIGSDPSGDGGWEKMESAVVRTAELVDEGNGEKKWRFTIGGVPVDPFDARPVITPCALDLDDDSHRPVPLERGSIRDRNLRIALYLPDDSNNSTDENTPFPCGGPILDAMTRLHELADKDRNASENGPSEGLVYDWVPLANASPLPSRTWRDALLAIRTRERDHVLLGQGVRSDGTGAPRDMTEGVVLRLFYALEMLYPTALRKEGAMKFRVRPRGAAYHHMLCALERLGRGKYQTKSSTTSSTSTSVAAGQKASGSKRNQAEANEDDYSPSRKRSRRGAAVASAKKTTVQLKSEGDRAKSRPRNSSKRLRSDDEEVYDDAGADEASEEDLIVEDIEMDGTTELPMLEQEHLPLPTTKTTLWAHQEASVAKVVQGVREGKRGHADASAVGAGKTLTALATITRLAGWIEATGRTRYGVLVMLPTKALIKEWLLEVATHTHGFHVIEQREDGTLFSLTYSKTHPPIDGNSLIITTLDRVSRHPFIRQTAWDFVVIDECLSVQNASAKRNPSAWRQIEVSMCGVLMLSATFFRSKYDSLFYMIRMLRSPLPRAMEWLPATIHEHIVCQIPETDRSWQLKMEPVPLLPKDLKKYRDIIEAFRRKQLNEPGEVDGRKLWVALESFLRTHYEGRTLKATYGQTSVMGDAFARAAKALLRKKRRPLIFADTSHEADFLMRTLKSQGVDVCTWAQIASAKLSKKGSQLGNRVIVAVKTVEGQGINMQHHADAIICRPTPGDHLEQMKGRVDRPGQTRKELLLVMLMAEHTIEECKAANVRLAGNFFREYIAPVATKYRERIDIEATLAAGGTKKLKKGTVSGAWMRSLEAAGQSGAFATVESDQASITESSDAYDDSNLLVEEQVEKSIRGTKAATRRGKEEEEGPDHKPLNKVIRNKGDPRAVQQAKRHAKNGLASLAVRLWLFPPKESSSRKAQCKKTAGVGSKPLPKMSLLRFSDAKPPRILNQETVREAVSHLSKNDPKLAAIIARVGAEALINDCGKPIPPTQARFFDRCVRAITFTMVSVDAGNAFMRRLAIKVGVCLEEMNPSRRKKVLKKFALDMKNSGDDDNIDVHDLDRVHQLLLAGSHNQVTFTHEIVGELVKECKIIKGKRTGYPHLCGVSFPCGKNDDHSLFLEKARAHAKGGDTPVSAGFSAPKASFIVSLVDDFEKGRLSGPKIAAASDRDAMQMLLNIKGIGDWCAGGILMNFLSRGDIILYGDLTVRNYLNDLYDINHNDASETLLESAADFGDTGPNRNLIDALAKKNGWAPYRTVINYLMWHLQEDELVLL